MEENESNSNSEDSSKDFVRIGYAAALCAVATYTLELVFYAALIIIVIQLIMSLLNGEPNEQIAGFSSSVGSVISSAFAYATFLSDEKPFPLSAWPSSEESNASDSSQTAAEDPPIDSLEGSKDDSADQAEDSVASQDSGSPSESSDPADENSSTS
ncbi:MAG: DUF4389 domain-containing protein [Halieaceae bacterium]|nr:DUF4389 domain-containing protein [Halieaceae bacterium]